MCEQIIVTIGNDGTSVVEVQGCRGPSCSKLTEALEKALGQVTNDVKTPEFLQAGVVQAHGQAARSAS